MRQMFFLVGAAATAVAAVGAPPAAHDPAVAGDVPFGFAPKTVPVDPKTVPRAGLAGDESITRSAPPGSAPPPADPHDIAGVWMTVNADQWMPYAWKPELAGSRPTPEISPFGTPSIETRECKPTAKFTGIVYPMQIIQTPEVVTIIQEEHRRIRRIYMNEALPKNPTPLYYGHSVGRWQGDTLVVETNGLKGEQEFKIAGSPDLRIVERIRKIDGGKRLEDDLTYYNDKEWSKPATVRVRYNWRPDAHLLEYSCEQNSDRFGRGYDSIR